MRRPVTRGNGIDRGARLKARVRRARAGGRGSGGDRRGCTRAALGAAVGGGAEVVAAGRAKAPATAVAGTVRVAEEAGDAERGEEAGGGEDDREAEPEDVLLLNFGRAG